MGESDTPHAPSLRAWLFLHLCQHAGHKRQQFVQGVEPRHLVRDQMLDAAGPRRRRIAGLGTKLYHKGPIARERRLGLVHASSSSSYAGVLVTAAPCPCLAESIE